MFLKLLFLLSFVQPTFAEEKVQQDVPMRIDLGVERCDDKCVRTPFMGENINVTITLIKDFPETWEGRWDGKISYDGETYRGSVHILVEATPGGYVFKVSKEVDGSVHVNWLDNMGQLKFNEVRSHKRKVGGKTHMPYMVTGPRYK